MRQIQAVDVLIHMGGNKMAWFRILITFCQLRISSQYLEIRYCLHGSSRLFLPPGIFLSDAVYVYTNIYAYEVTGTAIYYVIIKCFGKTKNVTLHSAAIRSYLYAP